MWNRREQITSDTHNNAYGQEKCHSKNRIDGQDTHTQPLSAVNLTLLYPTPCSKTKTSKHVTPPKHTHTLLHTVRGAKLVARVGRGAGQGCGAGVAGVVSRPHPPPRLAAAAATHTAPRTAGGPLFAVAVCGGRRRGWRAGARPRARRRRARRPVVATAAHPPAAGSVRGI